jgi:hypothetical protein
MVMIFSYSLALGLLIQAIIVKVLGRVRDGPDTLEDVPLKERADPYLPEAVQAVLLRLPVLLLPEESAVVDPVPSLNPYSRIRAGEGGGVGLGGGGVGDGGGGVGDGGGGVGLGGGVVGVPPNSKAPMSGAEPFQGKWMRALLAHEQDPPEKLILLAVIEVMVRVPHPSI